jgi:CheY-like chemotaxis protein
VGTDILLVEDNKDEAFLAFLAMKKANLPYTMQVAEDGVEALRLLLEEPSDIPKLILLDINLPKVSGLEVLKHLKKHPQTQDVPVIILTNSVQTSDQAVASAYGAAGYHQKPLLLSDFVALFRVLVGRWL